MKKKILVIGAIVCAAVILAAAVCLLPWPSRVDLTMYAVRVDKDGGEIGETEVVIRGWQWNYLLKRDRLDVDIEFRQDEPLRYASTLGMGIFTEMERPFTGYMGYCPEIDGMIDGNFAISPDRETFFMSYLDGYIVGSIHPDFDPKEILDAYRFLVSD